MNWWHKWQGFKKREKIIPSILSHTDKQYLITFCIETKESRGTL